MCVLLVPLNSQARGLGRLKSIEYKNTVGSNNIKLLLPSLATIPAHKLEKLVLTFPSGTSLCSVAEWLTSAL